MYTDRQAFTVAEICTPRKIIVQRDTATRTDKRGMTTDQEYTFTLNPKRAQGHPPPLSERVASQGRRALERRESTGVSRLLFLTERADGD